VDKPPGTRKRTPRVPANFLYQHVVPIALGVMLLLLLVVIVAVLLSLFGLAPGNPPGF
jgi:hypothetical protein